MWFKYSNYVNISIISSASSSLDGSNVRDDALNEFEKYMMKKKRLELHMVKQSWIII